ncbi:Hypothetical protein POVR1_LOCUS128 [uncultured virus]|nr:Hypothetical protein POVR1_LOCUS128 [uncultured virus]
MLTSLPTDLLLIIVLGATVLRRTCKYLMNLTDDSKFIQSSISRATEFRAKSINFSTYTFGDYLKIARHARMATIPKPRHKYDWMGCNLCKALHENDLELVKKSIWLDDDNGFWNDDYTVFRIHKKELGNYLGGDILSMITPRTSTEIIEYLFHFFNDLRQHQMMKRRDYLNIATALGIFINCKICQRDAKIVTTVERSNTQLVLRIGEVFKLPIMRHTEIETYSFQILNSYDLGIISELLSLYDGYGSDVSNETMLNHFRWVLNFQNIQYPSSYQILSACVVNLNADLVKGLIQDEKIRTHYKRGGVLSNLDNALIDHIRTGNQKSLTLEHFKFAKELCESCGFPIISSAGILEKLIGINYTDVFIDRYKIVEGVESCRKQLINQCVGSRNVILHRWLKSQ